MLRSISVAALVTIALATAARADDEPPPAPTGADEAPEPSEPTEPTEPTEDDHVHEDAEFGPVIVIEAIEISGNTATQAQIIRRALPVTEGDAVHASDPRLRDIRYKIFALGYFRDVTLEMRKGSARGRVVIAIHVVERGTFVLNRLWFGTNSLSPYWLGADVGDRNLLGLGLTLGGGVIYAAHGNIVGSRDQWAGELRLANGSLRRAPGGPR